MSFNGTACIVWYANGKQKWRFFKDSVEFQAELERIKKTIPITHIMTEVINWDTHEVECHNIQEELKDD